MGKHSFEEILSMRDAVVEADGFTNAAVETITKLTEDELKAAIGGKSDLPYIDIIESLYNELQEQKTQKKTRGKRLKDNEILDEVLEFDAESVSPSVLDQKATLDMPTVISLPLDRLFDLSSFEHPFQKSLESKSLSELTEQIKSVGLLSPIIVRTKSDGEFEILSGHRRKRACIAAGLKEANCIIKDVSDEEAKKIVCDNLAQREEILPSERAKAYKLRMDGVKDEVGKSGKKSREIVADENNVSVASIQRFLRLNELVPELLDRVDEKTLGIKAAVEISYLTQDVQLSVDEWLEDNKTLTLPEAELLKNEFLDCEDIKISEIDELLHPKVPKAIIPSHKQAWKLVQNNMKAYSDDMLIALSQVPAERLCEIIEKVFLSEIKGALKNLGKSREK